MNRRNFVSRLAACFGVSAVPAAAAFRPKDLNIVLGPDAPSAIHCQQFGAERICVLELPVPCANLDDALRYGTPMKLVQAYNADEGWIDTLEWEQEPGPGRAVGKDIFGYQRNRGHIKVDSAGNVVVTRKRGNYAVMWQPDVSAVDRKRLLEIVNSDQGPMAPIVHRYPSPVEKAKTNVEEDIKILQKLAELYKELGFEKLNA